MVKLALGDRDIRRDGYPKSNARPDHPGVVVEWQIGEACYRRAAEKYDRWQDDIRAVVLTREALRAVERWGAVSGEQYEGFRLELEAGRPAIEGEAAAEATAMPPPAATRMPMTYRDAAAFVEEHANIDRGYFSPANPRLEESVDSAFRSASKKLHPDAGGEPGMFEQLQEARDVILKGSR